MVFEKTDLFWSDKTVPPFLKDIDSFLEIVFVGLCEMFVCLEFVFYFFFFLVAKLIGQFLGCEFFKNGKFSP